MLGIVSKLDNEVTVVPHLAGGRPMGTAQQVRLCAAAHLHDVFEGPSHPCYSKVIGTRKATGKTLEHGSTRNNTEKILHLAFFRVIPCVSVFQGFFRVLRVPRTLPVDPQSSPPPAHPQRD